MAKITEFDRTKRKKKPGCPICGKPVVAEYRPFCSARCKTIDLGRWLGGNYRVETEDTPDEADLLDLARELEARKER